MILQGLSAETLARLVSAGALRRRLQRAAVRDRPQPAPSSPPESRTSRPALRLAAE